jgi:putative addiction module killer protein
VIEVRQTAAFSTWIGGLRDFRAAARIDARIGRLRLGNFGDVKSVGGGVSELRVDFAPVPASTSRSTATKCAGDERSQARDIKRAKAMAAELTGDG